jgi:hypothetical protein
VFRAAVQNFATRVNTLKRVVILGSPECIQHINGLIITVPRIPSILETRLVCLCIIRNTFFFLIYLYFTVTRSLESLRKLSVDKFVIWTYTSSKINIFSPIYVGIQQIICAPLYVNFRSHH